MVHAVSMGAPRYLVNSPYDWVNLRLRRVVMRLLRANYIDLIMWVHSHRAEACVLVVDTQSRQRKLALLFSLAYKYMLLLLPRAQFIFYFSSALHTSPT